VEVKWQQFLSALCFESNQPPNCTYDLAALRALPLSTIEAADGDYASLLDVFGRLQASMAIADVLPWTPIVWDDRSGIKRAQMSLARVIGFGLGVPARAGSAACGRQRGTRCR
jgi:hypothetical protein